MLLSDADLLNGVGGKGVRCGDQRGLSAVAIFISDVGELSNDAVGESEPVGARKDTKESGFRYTCLMGVECCDAYVSLLKERCGINKAVGSPVGALHVTLTLHAAGASPFLRDAIRGFVAEVEVSVPVVLTVVPQDDDRIELNRVHKAAIDDGLRGGGGGGDQAGNEKSLGGTHVKGKKGREGDVGGSSEGCWAGLLLALCTWS